MCLRAANFLNPIAYAINIWPITNRAKKMGEGLIHMLLDLGLSLDVPSEGD